MTDSDSSININHAILCGRGEGVEKDTFVRWSCELNNFFLRAVSSALDLPEGPFGWVHMLVSSDLKIWRPSNKSCRMHS